jgi:hypothetical protein
VTEMADRFKAVIAPVTAATSEISHGWPEL